MISGVSVSDHFETVDVPLGTDPVSATVSYDGPRDRVSSGRGQFRFAVGTRLTVWCPHARLDWRGPDQPCTVELPESDTVAEFGEVVVAQALARVVWPDWEHLAELGVGRTPGEFRIADDQVRVVVDDQGRIVLVESDRLAIALDFAHPLPGTELDLAGSTRGDRGIARLVRSPDGDWIGRHYRDFGLFEWRSRPVTFADLRTGEAWATSVADRVSVAS